MVERAATFIAKQQAIYWIFKVEEAFCSVWIMNISKIGQLRTAT